VTCESGTSFCSIAFRPDRGESGTGIHDGRHYQVAIELRSGAYFATVTGRGAEAETEAVAINLVLLPFDCREPRLFEAGSASPRTTTRWPGVGSSTSTAKSGWWLF